MPRQRRRVRVLSHRRLVTYDIDLPNRRVILAGHGSASANSPHDTLRAWLEHRHATWPNTLYLVLAAALIAVGGTRLTRVEG